MGLTLSLHLQRAEKSKNVQFKMNFSKVISEPDIRTHLPFAIMRALLVCLRSTRSNRTITAKMILIQLIFVQN